MLNLVFGSSYSSYMDCVVHCVLSVTIGLIRDSFLTVLLRRRLRRWPLHTWMFLLRFDYLKDDY